MTASQTRSKIARPRDRASAESASTGLLITLTDAGLAASVFALPFVMGGRQAWGHFAVGILACWTALCWSLHQLFSEKPRWRWSGAEPLFVAGIGLLIAQVVNLSEATLHRISPVLKDRLPMWVADSTFGQWTTISLTPHETLLNLLTVASCMLIFLVAVQRLQRQEDVMRILNWIAASTAVMATFGVAQLVFGNGKFFWFYEHPFTDATRVAKGAFTNANHFCHFIALGIPLWLWKFASVDTGQVASRDAWKGGGSGDRWNLESILAAGSLLVIGAALLLSQSRGGVVVGVAGTALTLLLLWRQKMVGTGTAMLVVGVAAACGVSLIFFGNRIESLVEQSLTELTSADLEKLDEDGSRRQIWLADIAAAKEFPILGTGLGSHAEVYPTYLDAPNTGVEYTHAENGYIQVAMETGVAGLTVVGLFILLVAYWCARGMWISRSTATSAPLAAIVTVLAMNLGHSVTDFIWYVPACMVAGLLLAACAVRLYQLSAPTLPAQPEGVSFFLRGAWATLAVGVMVFCWFTIRLELPAVAAEPHWFDYIRLTRALQSEGQDDDEATDVGLITRRLKSAIAAAKANPKGYRTQMAAAKSYVQYLDAVQAQSESAMPISQIREAAESNFEDVKEMQAWLSKPAVLGKRKKLLTSAETCARRALALCPLSSRAYLMVADLAWLHGTPKKLEESLYTQAMDVRPFDSRVQYVLGRECLRKGDAEQAMVHWRDAFQRDPAYRRQLIFALASINIPVKFFLENFDIDLKSLNLMRLAYREKEDQEGYQQILSTLAAEEMKEAKSTFGDKAVEHWMVAVSCFAELHDDARAIAAARAAAKSNPASFLAHQVLGNYLFDQGDFAGATKEFEWCRKRQPDNESINARLDKAYVMKGREAAQVAEEEEGNEENQYLR
jgi:O-antigen ligase/tetratricopeptide (TPR) repeat protein